MMYEIRKNVVVVSMCIGNLKSKVQVRRLERKREREREREREIG